PEGTVDRSADRLAAGDPRLVWEGRTNGGLGHGRGALVYARARPGPGALGAGPPPASGSAPLPPRRPGQYRPLPRGGRDRAALPGPLEHRGDLCRTAGAPGVRDAAALVDAGDRAGDPLSVRLVQSGRLAGETVASRATPRSGNELVSERRGNVQRCARGGAAPSLEPGRRELRSRDRVVLNPARLAGRPSARRLLFHLKGQSPVLRVFAFSNSRRSPYFPLSESPLSAVLLSG